MSLVWHKPANTYKEHIKKRIVSDVSPACSYKWQPVELGQLLPIEQVYRWSEDYFDAIP